MHIGYWWESQKERDHWEDLDVGDLTILGWIWGDRMGECGSD
jgi:carbohydrate-selective porin OprB